MKPWFRSSGWTWRHLFVGPAALLDGIIETASFGFVGINAGVHVAVWITKAQLRHHALEHKEE